MIYPRILETVFIGGEYNIAHNGIGSLPDCLSCIVNEEKNGKFVLQLSYPVGGFNWNEIKVGRFIVCKPNRTDTEQPFRIINVKRVANGKISVSAEHISYDMSRVLTEGFAAANATVFIDRVNTHSLDFSGNQSMFQIKTDIQKVRGYIYTRKPPRTLKSALMDSNDSFLSLYGGEMHYDGVEVSILSQRGENRGFQLGVKNLLSLSENFSIRDYATAYYPYWSAEVDSVQVLVTLPEKVLHLGAAEYSDVEKLASLDLSEYFEEQPTVDELRVKATEWINDNWKSEIPHNVSATCTIEKEDDVRLCDIVTVIYGDFDLYSQMQVIEYRYNVLTDECESIKIGDPLPSFEETIFKIAGGKKP